jgi:hypothetical protein
MDDLHFSKQFLTETILVEFDRKRLYVTCALN